MEHNTDLLERYVKGIYGDIGDNIELLIDSYTELYDLPTLDKEFVYDPEDFLPFLERRSFLLVCAYTRDGKFLTINKTKSTLKHLDGESRLIGRTVDDYSSFCLEQTANDIVERYTNGFISDLRPVCKMINRFSVGDIYHVQHGIVFLALVDGIDNDKIEDYEISFSVDGPEKMIFQNREALTLAISIKNSLSYFPTIEEIEHAPAPIRGTIHRNLIKPLLKNQSTARIRKAIFRRVESIRSVIDVSCGDDLTIFGISEFVDPDLVVANDINWDAMKETMRLAKTKNYHILFTNHHICEMPFCVKFDLAICKNTLHHISSADEMVKTLIALRRIARRLLVVDIEDPRRSTAAKIFNSYYEDWLGDGADDHRFLTKNKFRNLINIAYPDALVSFEDIPTIKGRYMLADVEFEG